MATTVLRVPVIESRTGRHLALNARFWNATISAGIVGAVVMALAMMIVAVLQGLSFFAPASAIAGTFANFRPVVLTTALPAPVVVGIILHLLVGIAWAILYALCFASVPRALAHYGRSLGLGVVLGVVAWIVTGMWIGPAVDPALRGVAPVPALLYHLVFGIITAWTFTAAIRGRDSRDVAVRSASASTGDRVEIRRTRRDEGGSTAAGSDVTPSDIDPLNRRP